METKTLDSSRWWYIFWGLLAIGAGFLAGTLSQSIPNPVVIPIVIIGILLLVVIARRMEWGFVIMAMVIYLRLSDIGVHQ
jgi:hypothetical protein